MRAAHGMRMHDSTFCTGSNRSGKGHRTTARPNGVYARLPLQKISVTVVHGDGRNRAGRATSTQLTAAIGSHMYIFDIRIDPHGHTCVEHVVSAAPETPESGVSGDRYRLACADQIRPAREHSLRYIYTY